MIPPFQYHEFAPSKRFKPFVVLYWIATSEYTLPANVRERILPDGTFEAIFNFGSRHKHYNKPDADDYQLLTESILVGQRKRHFETAVAQDSSHWIKAIGIRFRPIGLYRLMPQPLHECTEKVFYLEDLWGGRTRETVERLAYIKAPHEVCSIIEELLNGLLNRRSVEDPALDYAVHTLTANSGNYRIDELASQVGVGIKQLERKFLRRVGLTPKRLARILRFQRICDALERGVPFDKWTDLAFAHEYYDQNHFIKEFKEFSGLTPGEYQRERTAQSMIWT